MQIRLHNVTVEDIEDMVRGGIYAQAVDAGRPDLVDEDLYIEMAKSSIGNPSCWIAKVEEEFAGMLLAYEMQHPYRTFRKVLAEYLFFIKPEYRESSAASRLLKAFEDYAKEINCDEVLMCKMPESNINLDKRGYILQSLCYFKEM